MKTKILGFGAAVPLFALALLGLPNTANAGSLSLSNGDTLNVNGSIQLDNFFPNAGIDFDGLFVPEIGSAAAAPLGELAFANAGSLGNTGGFADFNNPNAGTTGDARLSVRSFNPGCVDGSTPGCNISGFTSSSYFALLDSDATYPSGSTYDTKYVFSVTQEPTASSFAVLTAGLSFDFITEGLVQEIDTVDGIFGNGNDIVIGNPVDIVYNFTVQGINDPDGDGLTEITTYSGSAVVSVDDVIDIPEGNNIIGLLSLAGLAAVGMVKGRSTNKSHVNI